MIPNANPIVKPSGILSNIIPPKGMLANNEIEIHCRAKFLNTLSFDSINNKINPETNIQETPRNSAK